MSDKQYAEILMGEKTQLDSHQYFFGLIIDGEVIFSTAYTIGYTISSSCEAAAEEFSRTLKEKNVSKYSVTNGKRITTNGEIDSCNSMPEDNVEVFKETLDAKLKE